MTARAARPVVECLLCAALLVGSLSVAQPASADDLKIGVIHIERVMSQSPAAKAAHDKIQKEFEARDREISAREREVRDALAQYAKDKLRLTEEQRAARERELDTRGLEAQRLRQKFAEDLHARQFEELDRLKEMLDRAITRIAHEQNFDLILQNALYIGASVDITDEVLKALQ